MRLYVDDELTHVTQSCIDLDSSLTCSDHPLVGTQKQKPLPFWPHFPALRHKLFRLRLVRVRLVCANFGSARVFVRKMFFCKICVCV